jgi:hypothetical protein
MIEDLENFNNNTRNESSFASMYIGESVHAAD